jgi:metal-responsive CopG/Arc/MetJ family transcriptional regulator
MSTVKVAVSIEKKLIERIDQMVKYNIFPNRSKAFQIALEDKIIRIDKSRLARECSKLDQFSEQQLADEGLTGDLKEWPEY